MTREEAKLILQACHPGGDDFADPRVAAALEQAQRDPDLRVWLHEQRAFDAVISDKLEHLPVPLDLEARIIRATRGRSEARPRWNTAYLALAASIVLVASILLLWLGRAGQGRGNDPGDLRADLANFLREFPRLDLETERWSEINEWLTRKATLADLVIPSHLKKYPGLGCRELRLKEKRLLMVCFVAQGEVVHFFVVPRSELPEPPSNSTPQFTRVNGWSTASWTRGEASYLVLTKGSDAFLKSLFTDQSRG